MHKRIELIAEGRIGFSARFFFFWTIYTISLTVGIENYYKQKQLLTTSANFVAHPNSSVFGSWPTFLCKTQGTHTASTTNSVKGGFRCTIASFN